MKKLFNIGMFGYESINSWTPRMAEELNKMGYRVQQFSVTKTRDLLSPMDRLAYLNQKKAMPLSVLLSPHTDELDAVIVAQSYLYTFNDLKIPVVYYHTETSSPYTMRGSPNSNYGWPTHCAMKLPEAYNFLHSYDPWGYNEIGYHFYLYPAAHPPFFDHEAEKVIDVSYIGAPSDMFDKRQRDWLWNRMLKTMHEIEAFIKLRELAYVYYNEKEVQAGFKTYNQVLQKSKHMILTAHEGVYLGRRHIECLAAHTIPIIYIECDAAKKIFHELGFQEKGRYQNCYFYYDTSSLEDLIKGLEYDPEIANRGYEVFMNNHTFGHRALTLIKVLEMTLDYFVVRGEEEVDKTKGPTIHKSDAMV